MWINVKDRLPNANEFVLTYDGTGGVCMAQYTGVYFGFLLNGQNYMIDATHWMPMPEPPKE